MFEIVDHQLLEFGGFGVPEILFSVREHVVWTLLHGSEITSHDLVPLDHIREEMSATYREAGLQLFDQHSSQQSRSFNLRF